MNNNMKTFEKFLEEDVWEPEGVLDDDMPDAFDTWCGEQDVQEIMDWADRYGKVCFIEGQKQGIIQGGELATKVMSDLKTNKNNND